MSLVGISCFGFHIVCLAVTFGSWVAFGWLWFGSAGFGFVFPGRFVFRSVFCFCLCCLGSYFGCFPLFGASVSPFSFPMIGTLILPGSTAVCVPFLDTFSFLRIFPELFARFGWEGTRSVAPLGVRARPYADVRRLRQMRSIGTKAAPARARTCNLPGGDIRMRPEPNGEEFAITFWLR